MKRFLKKALVAFSLIFFLLYIVAFIKPFQKVVLNFFVKSFEKEQGIQLMFDDVKGNLFYHLNFTDVRISKIAEIPEFDIRYNIFNLIINKKIGTIYIKKPYVNIEEALKLDLGGQGKSGLIIVDSFVIDSSNAKYKDFSLPFSLFMKIRENSVELKKFSLNYPGSDFFFTGDYKLDGELDFFYKFNLDLAELTKIEGRVSSEGKLKGTGKNPIGSGNLSFSSDYLDRGSLRYELRDSMLYIRDINIIDEKISLAGNAIFNFRKNAGDFALSGTASNKKFNIHGKLDNKNVVVDLRGKEINATLESTLGDTINLTLEGKYKKSPINMSLSYISEHLNGNFSVPYISINKDVSLKRIASNFDLRTNKKSVEGKVNLNVERIFFRSEEIGGLNILSDFKEGKAILITAGLIEGKGEFQMEKPAPFFFDFSMKNFSLNAFLPEGKGKADFSGKIKGEIAKPKDITVSLYIENLESNFREYHIHSTGRIPIKYLYPDVLITPSVILVNETKLSFSGEIPVSENEEFKFDFSTLRFPLEVLNPFVEVYDLKGLLDLDFSISGKRKSPKISGHLKLDSLFLLTKDDIIGPVSVNAEITRNHLTIGLLRAEFRDIVLENSETISVKFDEDFVEIEPSKINLFDNHISFSGIIPIPFKGETDLNISTDEFMLKSLNSLIPGKTIDGNLSLAVRILKTKPFPSLSGKINVDELVLQVKDKNPVGPLSLSLLFSGDTIKMDRFDFLINENKITNVDDVILNLKRESIEISQVGFKIGDNLFSLYGKMGFDTNSEFDIYCDFDSLDLSILSPFFPGSVFSGTISSSLNLKGTRAKPQVYGNLVLDDNNFEIEGNKIGPVNGLFSFKGDIIDCSDIIVGFNKGYLLMNGSIGIDKKASLNVGFAKIEIPIKKKSHLSLNGQLQLSGSFEAYSVSGEVKIDGSYMDPFENQLIVGLLKRADRPHEKHTNILEKIRLNVGIGSNFIVNNREAFIETESDLYVSGSAAKPTISGETRIIEGGHLNYLGTKFNINAGTITFSDPLAIKPELYLRASSEILHEDINYSILLNITGTPENLRIDVSSEPYLPVQEVLALLITGKTRKIEPISGAQGIGIKAVNHILDITKGRVEDRLAGIFGVEKVTLESSTDIKIGLEKQFGEKMRVSYKTGFEDFTKPQLVIYYDITRNISVFSIYDRENRNTEAGFDINLKR